MHRNIDFIINEKNVIEVDVENKKIFTSRNLRDEELKILQIVKQFISMPSVYRLKPDKDVIISIGLSKNDENDYVGMLIDMKEAYYILFSPELVSYDEEEIIDTIAHELAHLKTFLHNRKHQWWQQFLLKEYYNNFLFYQQSLMER